ncbi:MAG TPA: phosphoribosylglycinamide formyltransferase [Segetibacter sp.]
MSGRLSQPEKTHLHKRIAIFASGAGSNAKKIIEHFAGDREIHVGLIVCNKPGAGVLNIASDFHIPVLMIEKDRFLKGNCYVDELKNAGIDFIVLAGFLWKIPEVITQAFRNRIINIHPSLLPKYGGKGMYGSKVHEAVITAGEKQSGITIHYVDEHYDNGDIIFQATCPVFENDTPDTLAEKIHKMEHENFPRIVDECVSKMIAEEKDKCGSL